MSYGSSWREETLKAFDPRHKNSKRKGRKWERGKNLKEVTQIRRQKKEIRMSRISDLSVCYKRCLIQRPGGGF